MWGCGCGGGVVDSGGGGGVGDCGGGDAPPSAMMLHTCRHHLSQFLQSTLGDGLIGINSTVAMKTSQSLAFARVLHVPAYAQTSQY